MRRGIDLLGDIDGPSLRMRLMPVVPEAVAVRPVPRLLIRLWPGWVSAMCLPWGIYVHPDRLAGDPDALARLIAHELVHTRQWKTLGPVGFLRRYLADYLRGRFDGLDHRSAYEAITLEREARAITEELST